MEPIMEMYGQLHNKAGLYEARINAARASISSIEARKAGDVPARISKLEEQLKKIDDYLTKIEAFKQLAEKNMISQNVLTIEAPPNYRVNLNRLRQWAMMIDPTSADDPYAQRVYVTAQCDLCFLRKKKQEFSSRIEELRQDENIGFGEEISRLEGEIAGAVSEYRALCTSPEMTAFAEKVSEANQQYWYEFAPQVYGQPTQSPSFVSPGAFAAPLFAPEEHRAELKSLFGRFYDDAGSRVLLPVELPANREFAMSIVCTPARSKQLDRGIQNLLLNYVEKTPPGQTMLYVLDGVRFNSAALGPLRRMEGSFALAPLPRNPDQLTSALEQIVAAFPDLDDTLDLCDSVAEYNEKAEEEKRLSRTVLILYGWPNAYEGRDREYLQRIMTNYERYGISFICISHQSEQKKDGQERMILPDYAAQNAIQIRMMPKETTIQMGEEPPRRFTWYTFSDALSDEYIRAVTDVKVEKSTKGNEYPKRYDCVHMPEYTREYKKIELPYGIDGKDQAHSVSFENENFAAYLVGASRSGKSTLLHTLIAGIIRNYHPDNVELWLADFKQLEFKKYMVHCPPHVRYVLLDESTELVFDLIDKLTDKMMERQRIFARLGKERLDQIDPTTLSEPMPVIFVILDEFSIMSQAIAESESYRLRLQNLLAKGAALGFKFLFSSQTFTTGIAGLTPTARAQIQQRIAMKGTKEEISETLELSANLKTEQVRNWIDALPPHYALVKYRISADQLPQVMRTLVMYIPDYNVRDDLIDTINREMTPVEQYTPTSISTYVDKHPVLVDGNTYLSFEQTRSAFQQWRQKVGSQEDLPEDGLFLNVGTPRKMESMFPLTLSRESRENILLIGSVSEYPCVGAIVFSAIKSCTEQGATVRIWAYERDKLFRTYKHVWGRYDAIADIDCICDQIAELKKSIEDQKESNELIILFGAERLCADFELAAERKKGGGDSLAQPGNFSIEALVKSGGVEEQADGEEDLFAFLLKQGAKLEGGDSTMQKASQAAKPAQKAVEPLKTARPQEVTRTRIGAYNAQKDLEYILRQGSRLGYHILLVSNSLADVKQSGFKLDLFEQRLAFQMNSDASWEIFHSKIASKLPIHICQYTDTITTFSFRPYLHQEFAWENWIVDENGQAHS